MAATDKDSEPTHIRHGNVPQTLELLAAYFDLASDSGPIHARTVADTGRRFLAREPIPLYQVLPAAQLRACISRDCPQAPRISDPRELAQGTRTPPWDYLCAQLDEWDDLDPLAQLEVAQVLYRLGFWAVIISIVPVGHQPEPTLNGARLALLCYAAADLTGEKDPGIQAGTRELLAIVATNVDMPPDARLRAATNLVVHHARGDHSISAMQRWHGVAQRILADHHSKALDPVLLSTYWRGVSFVPYVQGDRSETIFMLDEAERLAHEALATEKPEDGLLATEVLYPLLETRGRTCAEYRDFDGAEHYYRALVVHDPLACLTHFRLAEFLLHQGRFKESVPEYRRAADLGAPITDIAQARLEALAQNGFSE